MAQAQLEPHHVFRDQATCPRCAGALKQVHNRSRWGRTLQLECRRQHGAFQTFAQFLTEKGLLRSLTSADRAELTRRSGSLWCLNCGAALGLSDKQCGYCASAPGLVDIARLANALDPEGATESHAVHAIPTRQVALQCLACGAALSPQEAVQCGQCGATLAVGRLADAHAAVKGLAAALRAHERSPAPHVRERRLQRNAADLPRRRAWVREMEASAHPESGQADEELHEELADKPWGQVVPWVALALLVAWWLGAFR
jgi:hypothetical protein